MNKAEQYGELLAAYNCVTIVLNHTQDKDKKDLLNKAKKKINSVMRQIK